MWFSHPAVFVRSRLLLSSKKLLQHLQAELGVIAGALGFSLRRQEKGIAWLFVCLKSGHIMEGAAFRLKRNTRNFSILSIIISKSSALDSVSI